MTATTEGEGLDLHDDFVATVCTEDSIDLAAKVEVQPPAQRTQRKRIQRLLAKRRRLKRDLAGIGPCTYQRERAASLAGVEAELSALDVDVVEDER